MSYYDFRKVTALVVDDSRFILKVMNNFLYGFGVGRVELCRESTRALDCVRDVAPDILFVDLEMPDVSGLQIVRAIRRGARIRSRFIPIVMVTALTKALNLIQARDAGVTAFLAKPVSAPSLYERLVTCVETSRPFIRSTTYCGPDRRQSVDEGYAGPERRRDDAGELSGNADRVPAPAESAGPSASRLDPQAGATHP